MTVQLLSQIDGTIIIKLPRALVNNWFPTAMFLFVESLISYKKVVYIYQIEAGFEICEIGGI